MVTLKKVIDSDTCKTYEQAKYQVKKLFKKFNYNEKIDNELIEIISKNIINNTMCIFHDSAQFWRFYCRNDKTLLEIIQHCVNKNYEIRLREDYFYNFEIAIKLPNRIVLESDIFSLELQRKIKLLVKTIYFSY